MEQEVILIKFNIKLFCNYFYFLFKCFKFPTTHAQKKYMLKFQKSLLYIYIYNFTLPNRSHNLLILK